MKTNRRIDTFKDVPQIVTTKCVLADASSHQWAQALRSQPLEYCPIQYLVTEEDRFGMCLTIETKNQLCDVVCDFKSDPAEDILALKKKICW